MALYNGQSRLRDVIFSHPAVIPVINRLGVRLGVGDDCRFMPQARNRQLVLSGGGEYVYQR